MNLLNRTFFVSFTKHICYKVCHVASCQRNMLNTAIDYKPISYWNNVSNSISRIQYSSCVANTRIYSWWRNESKYCLNSNIQSFCVECLEHNLCKMLSILWWVEWRFSHNKDSFFRITSQVIENTSVPILFHQIPIPDNTSLDGIDNFLSSGQLSRILSDNKIEGLCDFSIAHSPTYFWTLVSWVGD